MAGNQLEQEIIRLYNKDITRLYSINEIATHLQKAYPYINKKVTGLIKENILKKTVIGRSHLCSINLENDEAIFLLILNEVKKLKRFAGKDKKLAQLSNSIRELGKGINISLALKVKNKIIFVLENLEDKAILEKSASLSSLKIEACTKTQFLSLLLKSRDILDNHVILQGYEKYYTYFRQVEAQARIKYSAVLK